ncbi:pectin lyase, partial [Leptodontidium sp. 2 PMI_412]
TKSLGRQHYSFGQGASSGVTISNSFIDGETEYSASCDGHTYWGLELVGEADQITFYKNYVYMTSGRTPALSGTTFFHAVNNVWSSNSGHMIEGTDNGMGVYEGNYIVDCPNVVGDPAPSVTLFTSEAADVSKCAATMGRNCVPNELFNSGDFNGLGSSSDILSQFSGLTIIDTDPVSSIKSAVVSAAGNTL